MEYFDICAESGLPTGEVVSREIAHQQGILHRSVHIWIVREEAGRTQVLLQKRSQEKDSYPGMYDTSSAGHISAGEEPLPSALRELEEELGIRAEPEELTYAGFFRIEFQEIFHGKPFRDNEYVNVYVYSQPVDIRDLTLQKDEVEEVRWFDLAEVETGIRTRRDLFCVPEEGLRVLKGFLNKE